ncbi:hypothetical protein K438DRAFT_1776323 [Mycena galopus ATCC 62051]|nr:hypothetical protein K438DRAFT_1776323 [Mycena galopus ATCC 62051]
MHLRPLMESQTICSHCPWRRTKGVPKPATPSEKHHFFATSLKAVVIIFCTTFKAVNAAIWTPGRSSVVRIPDNGARFYFNNGGQIQAIANTAGNSTNPSTCNSWVNGTLNFTPFGVSNVAPSSAIASVAYAIVFISWENALGQLTESWTADVNDLAASWSAPMVIST